MTDSTWRWGFSEELKGSNLYVPFMNNAIRWPIQDPELELVRLELSDDAPIPTTVQRRPPSSIPTINRLPTFPLR